MNKGITYHFEVVEGCDFSQTFLYTDPVTTLPIDLTNYTADMKLKQGMNGTYDGFNNPSIVMELSTSIGGITLGGTAGTVTITIAANQTQNLTWNRAVYNLTLIGSTGTRTPFLGGFFTIISDADS
jgi:hypothetical protein